jgi:multiple antibiotic resistance protein
VTSLDYPTRLFIEHALFVFAALFPVVNPLGGAPVFLAMTQGMPDGQRALLARRIGVNAFLLVMGSILAGNYVIGFFGLSVPVIQVGGGLLVCALAWQLLHNETADQVRIGPTTPEQLAARAFYPMTLPLTVGPGSISVAITLGAQSPRDASGYAIAIAASTVGALSLAASIYFLFRYADRMARFLGAAGTQVLLRLSAFILLCIGVQIVWNGVFALLGTIPTFRAR